MKIVIIVGARPNLMKMAPLLWEMRRVGGIDATLVHTGQHYDERLSDIFFQQLEIPVPNFYLGVGSGSHSYQTARIMLGLEGILAEIQPDWVVVVGDVNSTLAAALVAAKLHLPLAHVEAGLRSFDRTMPEEINRIVVDSVANLLFITESSGVANLRREGLQNFLNHGRPIIEVSQQVLEETGAVGNGFSQLRLGAFVGNVMIDTLLKLKARAEKEAQIQLPNRDYSLVTLHRPSNVDEPGTLRTIVETLSQISQSLPVLFPCHPRTRNRLREYGLDSFFTKASSSLSGNYLYGKINLLEPLGYLDFLQLMSHARLVLTDSGGIQEETTILKVPCLTLRENTERPVTISEGTNILAGTDPKGILTQVQMVLNGQTKKGGCPIAWDGQAAGRIVQILQGLH